jgi:hypothetical protein
VACPSIERRWQCLFYKSFSSLSSSRSLQRGTRLAHHTDDSVCALLRDITLPFSPYSVSAEEKSIVEKLYHSSAIPTSQQNYEVPTRGTAGLTFSLFPFFPSDLYFSPICSGSE